MNAADPKQTESARIAAQHRRDCELNDLRVILQSPAGIRFFRRMFDLGHMESDPYTGNSATFYNLGLQKFAKKYWNDVKEADVAAFVEIIKGEPNA